MSQVFGRSAVAAMVASAMAGVAAWFPIMTGQSAGRFPRGAKKARTRAGDKLARMAEEKRIAMPSGNTYVGATITWPQSRAKAKKARTL